MGSRPYSRLVSYMPGIYYRYEQRVCTLASRPLHRPVHHLLPNLQPAAQPSPRISQTAAIPPAPLHLAHPHRLRTPSVPPSTRTSPHSRSPDRHTPEISQACRARTRRLPHMSHLSAICQTATHLPKPPLRASPQRPLSLIRASAIPVLRPTSRPGSHRPGRHGDGTGKLTRQDEARYLCAHHTVPEQARLTSVDCYDCSQTLLIYRLSTQPHPPGIRFLTYRFLLEV